LISWDYVVQSNFCEEGLLGLFAMPRWPTTGLLPGHSLIAFSSTAAAIDEHVLVVGVPDLSCKFCRIRTWKHSISWAIFHLCGTLVDNNMGNNLLELLDVQGKDNSQRVGLFLDNRAEDNSQQVLVHNTGSMVLVEDGSGDSFYYLLARDGHRGGRIEDWSTSH
jgi:hypothetical protein